ncbi:type II toxin-antitoxin system HicB family antitoxin [Leptothrix discophora]|uniref:Type II toxin-antitoxin system HicB family antitoxin n=1 Tax=Leptothrix discophora TaxID=89 RepID=A0ABT9G238_LEPDI|nr:type II toxin-antitoxin system HicB family antitoxin [Leptothrix discophora]MDP4300518.1 type II toxin-antitoxin system HicB family antitoxin [Leptothrix discophora]
MSFITYPVVIDLPTDQHGWGVVVPDLPGCFAGGDSLAEALAAARKAARHWIETARADGLTVPSPSSIEALQTMPDYLGWVVRTIEVDTSA